MKVSTSTVTKLAITGVFDMDAISAMIEDFGPGAQINTANTADAKRTTPKTRFHN